MVIDIDKQYEVKWTINDNYYITRCNNIINRKNNKILKQCLVNYTLGYYLNSKFKSIKYIRENCKLIKEMYVPF